MRGGMRDKVSESWKRNMLKRMMHSNSFYGVMFARHDDALDGGDDAPV